ncbi:odorant receptor 275 [Nasonia vitripennis]|uniref:Odorant receptor n=1 Tax=Nasonia vitripennis TaxID=7425 RepID=A0A7M6UG51_NASVI|nr:odorant receptor 275 [Nasonia vitripennis]
MQSKERDKPKVLDIEYYFDLNIRVMSLIGLRCDGPKITGFVHRIPTYTSNTIAILILIFEICLMSDPVCSSNMELTIQTASQTVSNIQCVSKGFLFVNAIEKLQVVYNELQVLSQKYPLEDEIQVLVFDIAEKTMNFCKYYAIAICSCILFYYTPIVVNVIVYILQDPSTNHTFDFTQTLFYLKYPFTIKTFPIYSTIVSIEAVNLIAQGIFWFLGDTLFAQVTTHICIQFKILKHDIQKTFNDEGSKSKEILIGLIKRHRQLISMCMLTEDIFSPVIFSVMILSSTNLCVNIIGASTAINDGDYMNAGVYATILLITVFQIFFYCIFAEKTTEETRSLADTVYHLNWAMKDHHIRLHILLIIMRAQKPFYCTAYGFFPIGHQKLTSILSTAYSYYMMLRTTANV